MRLLRKAPAVLALLCLSSRARAEELGLLGYDARVSSVAGASVALGASPGVTYTNPGVKAFEDILAVSQVRPQAASMGKYWGNFCGDGDMFDKGVAPAEFVKKAFEGAVK